MQSKQLSDDELINEFISDCKLRNFSEESIRSYKSILQITYAFLKRNSFSFVSLDKYVLKRLLEHLVFEKGYSVKTLENYFSALSSFYDFLVYEGVVDRNIVFLLGRGTFASIRWGIMLMIRLGSLFRLSR
ncbi:MAG: phage integrase N-terminal SAM-like domain-containing protein [Candidatus Bathyarchaeota archaeon]|nr:phage integrase N-terminal SAM-like domain-containing protein [Candidatus Bathyarchaeota archaeon]